MFRLIEYISRMALNFLFTIVRMAKWIGIGLLPEPNFWGHRKQLTAELKNTRFQLSHNQR